MSYSASDIEILEDLEHVRKRPSMYVGDTGPEGLHHIVKEVIDNAVDEYMEGHVTQIEVNLSLIDNIVSVKDNGRGIPIEVHSKSKESALITVFTKLHAGGKFDKRGAYSRPIVGLHGIGVKATNALSEWMCVYTYDPKSKKTYEVSFEKGSPETVKPFVSKNEILDSGLLVEFKPDPNIFGEEIVSPKRIRTWLKGLSYLCPGLRISFGVDDQEIEVFRSSGGLKEMLLQATSNVELYHDPLVLETDAFDLALAWTDQRGEHWKSYVNTSPTPEHGTHVKGVQKAIKNAFKQDGKSRFRSEDLRDGLIATIHARVSDPEFRGQTKVRLENKAVEDEIAAIVEEKLKKFLAENVRLSKDILNRATQLASARKKFRAEQEAIKGTKISRGQRGILPGKLCEAPDCSPSHRELFLVEGNSAGGTVKNARLLLRTGKKESHFQEILPLRGKVKNAARSDLEELLKNEELRGVVQAIGAGVGTSFDISKIRCKSVYLLMDADADGSHITALLLSFFAKFMPNLISEEKLYIVSAPLYMGVTKTQRVYGDTIEEVKKQLGTDKCRITRWKGLGESDAEDLRVYAMDPNTRRTVLVQWKGEEDQKLVLNYMGLDSSSRKEILGIIDE